MAHSPAVPDRHLDRWVKEGRGPLRVLWQKLPQSAIIKTMPQSSMNISLPESLRSYVESRVAEGHYSTPSEFVRDLIRRDLEHEEIEQKLLEALEEPAVPMGKNFWTEVRRAAHLNAKISSRPAKPSGRR